MENEKKLKRAQNIYIAMGLFFLFAMILFFIAVIIGIIFLIFKFLL